MKQTKKQRRPNKKFTVIADQIRQMIADMRLKDRDALPPEKKLAEKFKASHITIRKALKLLEAESLISKIPCHGNFVGAQPSARFDTSRLVGILFPDGDEVFFHRLLDLLEAEMSLFGYHPLVHITRRSPEKERQSLDFFRSIRVSGLLAVPNSAVAETYTKKRIPTVFIDNFIPDLNIPHVVSDDQDGARQVMEHLIGQGHRLIAHIGGADDSSEELRLRGYHAALKRHNIPPRPKYIKTKLWQRDWGYYATRELCGLKPRPTAIFCANDTLAFGALRYLRGAGIHCPRDISLAGFCDLEAAHDMQLTSVEQHCDQIAKAAWNTLRLVMAGKSEVPNHTIPTDLRIRGSTTPPRMSEAGNQ